MPPRVKICANTRPEDVAAAVAAGADLVGAVVVPATKRAVAVEDLQALLAPARGKAGRVAVTVDPDDTLVDGLAASGAVDLIQLHGHEPPGRVREVRARTRLAVVKALPVATSDDLAHVMAYAEAADLLLFDAKAPPGAQAGGNGLAFDWRLLQGIATGGTPWGLAGGLDPANVQDAVRLTGAGFVDVASGVESTPGIKDHERLRAFIEAAKRPNDGGKE
ncbi:MAG: phosphoribosylanthranilate isomerase [Geminicoccaceae bacterium]|nr:MAG: phosphoribosylanthranilate isomerase [Geminicoccaceae bacterium]